MITRVKLHNWRCHGDTELEFLKGTNVIVGVMGAGKSAVLDAISFALFGTFPALSAKKASLDGCIRNKPEQRNTARVELFFSVGGEDYSLLREVVLGKGTTRSELRRGDELLEAPQTKRVTEEVVRLLGMDYDLFSRAVYSEQNQINHFLQIPSGQRKKKIDELLKINRFEEARKSASALGRRMKSEAASAQEQLGQMPKPEAGKEKEALARVEARAAGAAERLGAAKKELAKCEEKAQSLEAKEKRRDGLRGEVRAAESKLEVYAQSQKEIEAGLEKAGDVHAELEGARARLTGAAEKIAALEKEARPAARAEAEKNKAALAAKVSQLEEKMSERKKLLDEKEKLDAGEWRQKLESAREQREALVSREKELGLIIKNSEERLAALSRAGDHCPVCDSEITGEKRGELEKGAGDSAAKSRVELEDVRKRLSSVGVAEAEEKVRALDAVEARLIELYVGKELMEARERLSAAEKECAGLSAKAESAEKELRELRAQKEGLSSSVARLESLLKDREKLDGINAEKQRLSVRISGLKRELEGLEFDEGALSAARQKAKELSARLGGLEGEAKSNAELLVEKRRLIREMEEREREMESLKKRGESLAGAAGSMEVFRRAVEDTQVQLREQFVAGVNEALGMVWGQLYPYGDYSRLRLGVEGGDYALELQSGGEWSNVEGFASGGEKSTAALALRIAFSMVLAPQLSWLVLDEPTHNLDSNGVSRLSKAMRESLPELVEQVFVITHDDEMEAAVSGNLYRIERAKEKGGAADAVLVSSGRG